MAKSGGRRTRPVFSEESRVGVVQQRSMRSDALWGRPHSSSDLAEDRANLDNLVRWKGESRTVYGSARPLLTPPPVRVSVRPAVFRVPQRAAKREGG